jgi:hypothetical protein
MEHNYRSKWDGLAKTSFWKDNPFGSQSSEVPTARMEVFLPLFNPWFIA